MTTSDAPTNFDPAATVTFVNISKRHADDFENGFLITTAATAIVAASDNSIHFDHAAAVNISTISKRHGDEIQENLYHLQEDQRVHDSLTDSYSVSNQSGQYHVHNHLSNLGHILEITSMMIILMAIILMEAKRFIKMNEDLVLKRR